MTKTIGILTGGGDVPGLNVAIKAVVQRALDHNIEVIGLRRGWWGTVGINPDDPQTLEELTMPLTPHVVSRFPLASYFRTAQSKQLTPWQPAT